MLRIYLVLGNIVRGGTAIHPARRRRLQTYTDFRVRERQMDDGWLPCPGVVMVVGIAWGLCLAFLLSGLAGSVVGLAWLLGGRLVATFLLVSMAGLVAHTVIDTSHPSRRAGTWASAVTAEYLSWRAFRTAIPAPTRHDVNGDTYAFLKSFLHFFPQLRRSGLGAERARHARRWAALQEVCSLLALFGLATGMFAMASTLMWSYGWIGDPESSPEWYTLEESPEAEEALEEGAWRDWAPGFVEGPVDWGVRRVGGLTFDVVLPATNVYAAALADYGFALARAVPLVELTDTLGLARPAYFEDERAQNVMTLAYTLSLVGPTIAFLLLVGKAKDVPTLEPPVLTDPVEVAVADQLLAHDRVLAGTMNHQRRAYFADAANQLADSGVPLPPGERSWTRWSVARVLRRPPDPEAQPGSAP